MILNKLKQLERAKNRSLFLKKSIRTAVKAVLFIGLSSLIGCESLSAPIAPEKPKCLEYPSDLWDKIDSLQREISILKGETPFNDQD